MRQMTGDILSLGSELFVHQSYIQLQRFSPNRLDLKLLSVHENDSGIYTCMSNDERLISYFVEVFGKWKTIEKDLFQMFCFFVCLHRIINKISLVSL